jgi:hypothetical protein
VSYSYVRCFSSRHWEATGQPKHCSTFCREVDEYYPARHCRVMVFPGGPDQLLWSRGGYFYRAGSPWNETMREKFHA